MVDHLAPGAVGLAADDFRAAVLRRLERLTAGVVARNGPLAAKQSQIAHANGVLSLQFDLWFRIVMATIPASHYFFTIGL